MDLTAAEIKKLPVFFIIGRPRSGTTLLRTLLDAHPNVAIPTECSFIGQLYKKYHKVKYWDKKILEKFFSDFKKVQFYKTNNFNEEKLIKLLHENEGDISFQEICRIVILSYDSVFNKSKIQLLGDKNPIYSNFFDKIYPIFPEAKFVHIVRDYRDTYVSLFRARFENPIISFTVKRWIESIKCIEDLKMNDTRRFFTLRYEDLVKDPEKYLAETCSFLEIDYYPEMLQFHNFRDEFAQVHKERIFSNVHKSLFNPISQKNVGKWKESMLPKEVALADYIAGPIALKYGYNQTPISGKKKNYYLKSLPGIILYHFIRIYIHLALGFPLWWQHRFFHNMHRVNGSILYKFYKRKKQS